MCIQLQHLLHCSLCSNASTLASKLAGAIFVQRCAASLNDADAATNALRHALECTTPEDMSTLSRLPKAVKDMALKVFVEQLIYRKVGLSKWAQMVCAW